MSFLLFHEINSTVSGISTQRRVVVAPLPEQRFSVRGGFYSSGEGNCLLTFHIQEPEQTAVESEDDDWPSNDELIAFARRNRPPQEWYDESIEGL